MRLYSVLGDYHVKYAEMDELNNDIFVVIKEKLYFCSAHL